MNNEHESPRQCTSAKNGLQDKYVMIVLYTGYIRLVSSFVFRWMCLIMTYDKQMWMCKISKSHLICCKWEWYPFVKKFTASAMYYSGVTSWQIISQTALLWLIIMCAFCGTRWVCVDIVLLNLLAPKDLVSGWLLISQISCYLIFLKQQYWKPEWNIMRTWRYFGPWELQLHRVK